MFLKQASKDSRNKLYLEDHTSNQEINISKCSEVEEQKLIHIESVRHYNGKWYTLIRLILNNLK